MLKAAALIANARLTGMIQQSRWFHTEEIRFGLENLIRARPGSNSLHMHWKMLWVRMILHRAFAWL